MRLAEIMAGAALMSGPAQPKVKKPMAGGMPGSDAESMQDGLGQAKPSGANGGQMGEQVPGLSVAPYMKMLTRLGYEYQGADQAMDGSEIGSTFAGEQGDQVFIKPDGSWIRFGPGAQRSQGKAVQDLGNALVKHTLTEGDDNSHHHALRTSGYSKIHTDSEGTSYYKHPQTGKGMFVKKDGNWGSTSGTGKGANKMRSYLESETMNDQDPQMQQVKLKQQQMKQQSQQMKQGGTAGANGRPQQGTRGTQGTRKPMGGMRFAKQIAILQACGCKMEAYGTSEGAAAGWDTRGRGKGSPQDHGFKPHGKYDGARLYRKDAPLAGSPHDGAKGVGKSFHELTVQKSGSWHMVHNIEPGSSGRIRYPDGSSSSEAGKNIGSGKGYNSFAKTQK